tara:strand:- start:6223 stop:6990 length:768 start_codon:yes stop_codon:yes gene_type:complete
MNKDSALNIALVGIGLCLLCSAIISIVAIQLRAVQENNVVLDQQKKIISSANLDETYDSIESAMKNISKVIINLETGKKIDRDPRTYDLSKELRMEGMYKNLSPEEDIASIKKRENFAKIYIEYQEEKVKTLILPVRGYGLWGIMYGYLAINEDLNTVIGLEFYEHKETPGLGAEIVNPKWKATWENKEIYDSSGKVNLKVIKGVSSINDEDHKYQIDGLSGATITSNGVTNLIAFWMGPKGYLPFIENLKKSDV